MKPLKKRHSAIRHKPQGSVRRRIPLFIVAVFVAGVVGVAMYSQQNQSRAANWTWLGSNASAGIYAQACKTLVSYNKAGRNYQLEVEVIKGIKGRPYPKNNPPYSVAIYVPSTHGFISKLRYLKSSTSYFSAGGVQLGILYPSVLLKTAENDMFMVGLGVANPTLSGGAWGIGPFASSGIVNCY